MRVYLAFVAAVALAACSTTTGPVTPPATDTPPVVVFPEAPAFFVAGLNAYRSNGWDRLLSTAITDLGSDLTVAVPADIGSYCTGYAGMSRAQRAMVWQNLLIALTKYESDYKPSVSFNETNVDPSLVESDGTPVISRGLLQISKGSANLYGCNIGNAEELHDPGTNLRCAVRIASRWVKRDGVIAGGSASSGWRGMARYWSPFRRADRLTSIQQAVRSTPGC